MSLMASKRARRRLTKGFVYIFLVMASVIVIFPYLWMTLTSFKPIEEFFTYPLQWLSKNWTLSQYAGVLEDPKFLASLRNSLLVSSIVTAMSLVLSIPAAYGLTRLRASRMLLVMRHGRPSLATDSVSFNNLSEIWGPA